jgi:predicted dehydrogenase
MAHTIAEGFDIIDAVRKTKRVVQVGTQRRSSELFQAGKKIMDSGQLGDVHLVASQWLNYQESLSNKKLEGNLDWTQWLGSAPKRELDPKRFFNWYYYWDYSGGLLVGQAAHIIDAINWYMNSNHPLTVTCVGGQGNLAGAEVPETATIVIQYPENYLAHFTVGYKAMRYNSFNDQIKQFHGTKARFDVGREWHLLYPQSLDVDMKPSIVDKRPGSFNSAARSHIRNFLECVRSRRDPNAPVEAGQATNIILCMAMDSLRNGKRLHWNPSTRKVES